MINEQALQDAMGSEIEDMPHDFDSLADWVRGFLERYEVAKVNLLLEAKHDQ